MARNGKIARLPYDTREELNHRLRNGHPAADILKWLNNDPLCKHILADQFDSPTITKQNLYEWTRGGYQAWLRLQESREQVEVLREQSSDLEKDTGDCSIADRITTLLSVQLLAAIQQLETIKDPKERWLQTKDLLHELHRLRREDHHAARIRLTREQWEDTWERRYDLDEETKKKRNKKKLLKWLHSLRDGELNAQLLGGGPDGRKWAHWFHCVENDLPLPKDLPLPYWWTDDGDSDDDSRSSSNASAQAESKPACRAEVGQRRVKPSQSKSNVEQASCLSPSLPHTNKSDTPAKRRAPARSVSNHKTPESSNSSNASQSKSNLVKPNQSKTEVTEPSSQHGHSCPQQHSAPAAAADTDAPTRSPPGPESNNNGATAEPPSPSGLPSPAEMLRTITVHQNFK